ncbi:MAG TPA: hypothetical protein VJQ54_18505 [Candidatus Sulfotelmatobacter sp.]|nr:hypothetical protein [Candidatus Sulfotelmatobacter sp.]
MKHNLALSIASVLSILFMTLHLTSDALRAKAGTPEAGGSTLIAVPILVVWLYGTLMLADRRSGYIIMLMGSLIGLWMPILHVKAAAGIFRGELAKGGGAFLFVWTLHALGVTAMFSLILSVQGLWRMRRSQRR